MRGSKSWERVGEVCPRLVSDIEWWMRGNENATPYDTARQLIVNVKKNEGFFAPGFSQAVLDVAEDIYHELRAAS